MTNQPHLTLETIIGKNAFSGIGYPTGIYWNADQSLFAVAGSFGQVLWGGRYVQETPLHYRVSLYEAKTLHRLAVTDQCRFPINEIAFHPDAAILAIATGCYDGGYLFEGDLLIWDYGRDTIQSILPESREVIRCRFDEEGENLQFLLRPWKEEDDDGNDISADVYFYQTDRYRDDQIELGEQSEIPLAECVFSELNTRQDHTENGMYLEQLASAHSLTYEERLLIWDVLWKNEREILCTGNHSTFELWDLDGRRQFKNTEGHNGVQIFLTEDQQTAYVHSTTYSYFSPDRTLAKPSFLFKVNLRTGQLTKCFERDGPYCFSRSSDGSFLARSVPNVRRTTEAGNDLMIDRDFVRFERHDLGNYNLINHYLRIDGIEELFFLQSEPKG